MQETALKTMNESVALTCENKKRGKETLRDYERDKFHVFAT